MDEEMSGLPSSAPPESDKRASVLAKNALRFWQDRVMWGKLSENAKDEIRVNSRVGALLRRAAKINARTELSNLNIYSDFFKERMSPVPKDIFAPWVAERFIDDHYVLYNKDFDTILREFMESPEMAAFFSAFTVGCNERDIIGKNNTTIDPRKFLVGVFKRIAGPAIAKDAPNNRSNRSKSSRIVADDIRIKSIVDVAAHGINVDDPNDEVPSVSIDPEVIAKAKTQFGERIANMLDDATENAQKVAEEAGLNSAQTKAMVDTEVAKILGKLDINDILAQDAKDFESGNALPKERQREQGLQIPMSGTLEDEDEGDAYLPTSSLGAITQAALDDDDLEELRSDLIDSIKELKENLGNVDLGKYDSDSSDDLSDLTVAQLQDLMDALLTIETGRFKSKQTRNRLTTEIIASLADLDIPNYTTENLATMSIEELTELHSDLIEKNVSQSPASRAPQPDFPETQTDISDEIDELVNTVSFDRMMGPTPPDARTVIGGPRSDFEEDDLNFEEDEENITIEDIAMVVGGSKEAAYDLLLEWKAGNKIA